MLKTKAPEEAPKASQTKAEKVVARKLTVSEVYQWWHVLRSSMESGLIAVYQHSTMIDSVMDSFTTGQSQAWMLFDMSGDAPQPCGLVWTRIINDKMFEKKSLMIEILYGTLPAQAAAWAPALEAVEAFAKEQGCDRVTAFSDNEHVMRLAAKYGFRRGYTMLAKDMRHD